MPARRTSALGVVSFGRNTRPLMQGTFIGQILGNTPWSKRTPTDRFALDLLPSGMPIASALTLHLCWGVGLPCGMTMDDFGSDHKGQNAARRRGYLRGDNGGSGCFRLCHHGDWVDTDCRKCRQMESACGPTRRVDRLYAFLLKRTFGTRFLVWFNYILGVAFILFSIVFLLQLRAGHVVFR